ncbi:hypothetical protein Xcel_0558 [Xylanimonas cellulosilytica DSM 15894]|uniref:Uncharacterized protein n=1 Tax=Xylanimonas cellulosilytica (strain DSM 15894 / JCM 12276 / CECT 5975 / KCTC 9989 / LMG 20990 / NBRC 107835 / XIL07) TaxID=446471 RepID=D1BWL5_XYLCX|nr:hypothetical protein [Xylanimonas cellulosilytica]ACZ29597.1 hypothetical protein Xcel_0558 [Xylanimonas cellulosilytica DSM 15894]
MSGDCLAPCPCGCGHYCQRGYGHQKNPLSTTHITGGAWYNGGCHEWDDTLDPSPTGGAR